MISGIKKPDINANEERQPLNQSQGDQQSIPPAQQNQQQNEQQVQQSVEGQRKRQTALQSKIQRAISILKFLISATMLLDVIFGELLCGFTQVCLFNGIESPKFLSQSLLLFMAITFVFLVLSYKFISILNKNWIKFLKFFLFFWAITLIVFGIVAIVYTSQNDSQNNFLENYQNFSDITQQYYENECGSENIETCLKNKYERNGTIVAIYHIINGALILLIFIQLVNMEIPDNFRPIATSRKLGQEKSFIIYDSRYTTARKKKQEKVEGEQSASQSKQDLEDPSNPNQNLQLTNLRGDPNPEPFSHLRQPYNNK